MPTDLAAVYAARRRVRAQTQTDITLVLVCIIIWLANLVLLFADPSFAPTIELMARY